MDNYFRIHDYLSSLPELKDPNTLESKCMAELSKLSNSDLLEEILSAIVDKLLTFDEIWKLPSITDRNVELLLNSRSNVYITTSRVNQYVDALDIWAFTNKYVMNPDFTSPGKYYTRINLPSSHFLINSDKILLNASMSIVFYKNKILEYFNDENIKSKYSAFNATINNDVFKIYIAEIAVKTANLMFGNINNTDLAFYNYMRYSLVELLPQKIIMGKNITALITKIKDRLFDKMLTIPAEQFDAQLPIKFSQTINELVILEVSTVTDGDIFRWAQQYEILSELAKFYKITYAKTTNDNTLAAIKLFSTTYNADLIASDSSLADFI